MSVIRFENVIKYYWLFESDIRKLPWLFTHKGHSKVKKAVDDISFCVKQGETIGIIGKNGAGKSTILKLIAGITKPNNGNIDITGRVTSLINLGAGLVPEFTGRQNIYYKCSLMGMSKKEVDLRIEEIIEFADIGEYIDIPIKTYSSGMRARLGFSIASNSEPEILLIDEIFAVGDKDFRQKSKIKTQELLSANKTVVITSHSESIIKEFCNRCIYMENGKVVYQGSTENAYKLYNNS